MIHYPLSKSNRIQLARAFCHHKRVDMGIPCVIEGQMGKAFVNDLHDPAVFKIMQGPFCYFAGDPQTAGGLAMLRNLEPYNILMPSPPEWAETAKGIHGDRLVRFNRYSFSPAQLAVEELDDLFIRSPYADEIRRIDLGTAEELWGASESVADIGQFDSAEDFAARGIGYALTIDGQMVGAAYSSLVCSIGIEVSIFVKPGHRRQGIATALACALLEYCLTHNMVPNWDAANPESVRLAEKLGYAQTDTYDAYFLKPA